MGALSDIKVLDLTRVLAGPYATMVLADLGAEIIKIEQPVKGDDSRAYGPYKNGESAYFMSLNRNKQSLTLNLKAPEGKEIFKALVKKVDVLVENYRPGTMEKLGLGYDVLKEINPRLIYASSTGYGQTGPYSRRPAYDAVVQAMGGVMSITGQADGEPTRVGTSIGDITAGLFCAIGILAASVLCNKEDQRSSNTEDDQCADGHQEQKERIYAARMGGCLVKRPLGIHGWLSFWSSTCSSTGRTGGSDWRGFERASTSTIAPSPNIVSRAAYLRISRMATVYLPRVGS